MTTCPICQSENQSNAHGCHYCGATLVDRKQSAPSQPAPTLLSRPQVQYNPLNLEVSETPYPDDLNTLELTIDSYSSDGGSLTMDLSESESEPLNDEEGQLSTAIHMPKRELRSPLNRIEEPHLKTVDEASDGLAPIDLDTPEPELSFNEPSLDVKRSKAKLSDLSGINSLNSLQVSSEPKFVSYQSTPLDIQSGRSALADLTTGHKEVKPVKSLLSFIVQIFIFATIALTILWFLGLTDTFSYLLDDTTAKGIVSSIDSNTKTDVSPTPITVIGTDTENEQSPHIVQSFVDKEEIIIDPLSKPAVQTQKSISTTKKRTRPAPKSISSKRLSYPAIMKKAEKRLMSGKVSQAITLFKQARQRKPSKPEPLAQLGWCNLAKKQVRKAISLFKRALRLNSGHGDSLYGLGYSYEKLNDKDNAIRYFNLYLSRYPKGSKVGVIKNKMRRLAP
jgi:TolA-binding protein